MSLERLGCVANATGEESDAPFKIAKTAQWEKWVRKMSMGNLVCDVLTMVEENDAPFKIAKTAHEEK